MVALPQPRPRPPAPPDPEKGRNRVWMRKLRPRKGPALPKASKDTAALREDQACAAGVWAWCLARRPGPTPIPERESAPAGVGSTVCNLGRLGGHVTFLSRYPLSSQAREGADAKPPARCAVSVAGQPCGPLPLPASSSSAAPLPPGYPETGRSTQRGQPSRSPGSQGGTVPGTPRGESSGAGAGAGSVTRDRGPEPLPAANQKPWSDNASAWRVPVRPGCGSRAPKARRRPASPGTPPGLVPSRPHSPRRGARDSGLGDTRAGPQPAGFPRLPRAGQEGGRGRGRSTC